MEGHSPYPKKSAIQLEEVNAREITESTVIEHQPTQFLLEEPLELAHALVFARCILLLDFLN